MTTWNDVKRYIHSNYKAEDLTDDAIKLLFDTGRLRSQLVFLVHIESESGEDWLQVHSPIGDRGEVDLERAAEILSTKVAGGLMIIGDKVLVTNSSPLSNLDTNELVDPMLSILRTADELENTLLGVDRH